MGIPGLLPAVRGFGVLGSLSGHSVVIDGPALVYQILEGCIRQRPATGAFICQPPYSLLGRMVIGWLEELRKQNVTIRKIYFDGYLPPSKWPVRRQRLVRQSELMKALVTSHRSGSPRLRKGAFNTVKATIALTRSTPTPPSDDKPSPMPPPMPPFLVPAVVEIMKSCRIWGPLVEVVCGEADMFCAEDVRRHGGLLLTTDSDLLITDLGPHGKVSFLKDIVESDGQLVSEGLVARSFTLNSINDALQLNHVGGLARVAFEKMKYPSSFSDALKRAKSPRNHPMRPNEFRDFLEGYLMKEYLPMDHPVQKKLSSLDPRISEIVIQTLLLNSRGTVPDARSRGPETLAMFLPVMIEDRTRKSAWTMSTAVRQLAYTIMQTFAVHPSPVVNEYRLLEASNPSMGRRIDVPGLEETLRQCGILVDALKKIAKRIPEVDMQWLAFAIYQDVVLSTSEERLPLSASLIDNVTRASSDGGRHSWDIIHFTAQVQASMYSLRMVKQAFDVAASLGSSLPLPVRELYGRLSALPAIADWPTVENMFQTLIAANEAQLLSTITDIIGIPKIKIPERPGKRKSGKGVSRREKGPKRPAPTNPFSVLDRLVRD